MSKPVVTEEMREAFYSKPEVQRTGSIRYLDEAIEAALSASPAEPVNSTEQESALWEYRTVEGPRKGDEPFTLESEGWERDYSRGREGEAWDRFDYHEEYYWKRRAALGRRP